MAQPEIVSAAEWQWARDELQVAEKVATREQDRLAAQRRRLPMVEFPEPYEFAGPDGTVTLLDLFGDLDQLVVHPIQRVTAEDSWTMPFVSSRGTRFAEDCGAGGGFVLSAFLRDGERVFRTYSTTQRGVDRLDWEDSPPGWPQHPTYG